MNASDDEEIDSAETVIVKTILHRKVTSADDSLILFCGIILMDDNKSEKKGTLDYTPFRPCQTFMYKCENKFHSSCPGYLLEDDERFGFIIVDGGGVIIGR